MSEKPLYSFGFSLIILYMKSMKTYFSSFASKEGKHMPRKCVVTGKKTTTGNARSHAMNANKRTWGANLQKVRILVDGKPKRVWVSARALRSGKVERV